MKKDLTEKKLAAMLLEERELGGWTVWRFLRKNALRWTLMLCFYVFLSGLGAFAQAWGFCGLMFGLLCGTFFQDLHWLERRRLAWPLYTKIIDWEKVQKIANGEVA